MNETMDEDMYIQLFSKTEDKIETENASYTEYKFVPEEFIDRSVIWYGTSGSGKSFHLKFCLNEVKHLFPRVVLFSTTNESSDDFKDIIHDAMIYNELTEHKIIEIVKAQIEMAEMYRQVNELPVLMEVFNVCASTQQKNMFNSIERALQNACAKVSGPENIKASEISKLRKTVNKKLIYFLKFCIIPNRNKIDVNKLSETAQLCVRYIDMNPRLLIIFDDCQEEVKELIMKKKSEVSMMFKNLFMRGRHNFITHWYTMQDDASLAPALRKNAKVSVLTQNSLAISFIGRTSNSIDPESKKLGLGLCNKLFQGENDYRKIIYFKEKTNETKFQYHTAKDPGLFRVGSVVVNEFCDEVH